MFVYRTLRIEFPLVLHGNFMEKAALWVFTTAHFAVPRLGTFVNGDKGLVVQANINLGGSINPVGFQLLFPVG
jgi:hypothetical protein